MIDQILQGENDGQWGVADRRVKPALLTLLHDQAALISIERANAAAPDGKERDEEFDLRSGFPRRRKVIEWYQRATVRTLGYLSDYWKPKDCLNDETLLSALITMPVDGVGTMPPEKARKFRRVVESNIVEPACNDAYKDLRASANEYIKTPDDTDSKSSATDLDPMKQRNVAMRPGFQSLDEQQKIALQELWDGFESEDVLQDWLHALNSPTNGEIGDVFSQSVMMDDIALERLVHDRYTDRARVYREALAVTQLLPTFVDGVKTTETKELAKTSQGAPTTFRMRGGQ